MTGFSNTSNIIDALIGLILLSATKKISEIISFTVLIIIVLFLLMYVWNKVFH